LKLPNIIRYIFNVWRKITDDLNACIIYSPLVYSKISYGLIKIIELSCTVRWDPLEKRSVKKCEHPKRSL